MATFFKKRVTIIVSLLSAGYKVIKTLLANSGAAVATHTTAVVVTGAIVTTAATTIVFTTNRNIKNDVPQPIATTITIATESPKATQVIKIYKKATVITTNNETYFGEILEYSKNKVVIKQDKIYSFSRDEVFKLIWE